LDRTGFGSAENVLWFTACRISCTDIRGAEAVLGVGPLLALAGTLGGNGVEAEGVGCYSVSGIVVILCVPCNCSWSQRCFLLYRAGCRALSDTGVRLASCVSLGGLGVRLLAVAVFNNTKQCSFCACCAALYPPITLGPYVHVLSRAQACVLCCVHTRTQIAIPHRRTQNKDDGFARCSRLQQGPILV
jgi:hypothetical protein